MDNFLRCYVEKPYKQDIVIMDDDKKVYRVCSCIDLNWLTSGEKKGYYLTAKFLYQQEENNNDRTNNN